MGYPYAPALFALPLVVVAEALPGIDPGDLSVSDPNRTWLIEVPTASVPTALASVLFFLVAEEPADRHSTKTAKACAPRGRSAAGSRHPSGGRRRVRSGSTPPRSCCSRSVCCSAYARDELHPQSAGSASYSPPRSRCAQRTRFRSPSSRCGCWSRDGGTRSASSSAASRPTAAFVAGQLARLRRSAAAVLRARQARGNDDVLRGAHRNARSLPSSRTARLYAPIFALVPVGVWLRVRDRPIRRPGWR